MAKLSVYVITYTDAPNMRVCLEPAWLRLLTGFVELVGKTTSRQVTASLSCVLLLAALGTPVVSIFGPTSPTRTVSLVEDIGAEASNSLSQCFSRLRRNTIHLECVPVVAPAQILSAVREQLAVGLGY